MKHLISSSPKSYLVSAALSLAAAALVCALWGAGVLASTAALFVPGDASTPSVPPQKWIAVLLILVAGVGAGLAVERLGARRASLYVAGALAMLCGMSFLVSSVWHLDILCAPVLFAAVCALAFVQVRRLWLVDTALTESIRRIALNASTLEGGRASERLTCGLKLLDTMLLLDEAVVFGMDEAGALVPAARLRQTPNPWLGVSESGRNDVWREGVRLCERAVASGEVLVQNGAEADTGGGTVDEGVGLAVESVGPSTVVVPLRHEGRSVGAVLLRLRENFDEGDRSLLSNVSAQFARNLQREQARALEVPEARESFYSALAAAHRLESFGVVSGLLAEQSFAGRVLSQAPDGHAVAYLDGTLAHVNQPMLDAARLSAKECRALDLFGLLDRFRAGVFDEPAIAVRRVLQTGQPYEHELFLIDRNETLALRISLVTEGESGGSEKSGSTRPLCLAVTARDVTRIKEYEKLKSDMVSLMSHELRTPITSINGFAELLVSDESLPAEAREFLGIISNESQRLSRMINAFLSVTQLEQKDRQEVLKMPLMLGDVVREAVANFQSIAKRKRIRLVETNGTKLPPVAADRSLITRAVANLVENAIKYSPERTSIMLSTALEADAVRVVVEDRGYGIPPEAVDRVWEKFYRVAREGHDKEEESTGLGLAFVREVVEQHGGEVELESEVGRGSKFSFTLPRL
ncbi:MAG: HAMP domain-containing histidine kinase [Acidobacteria bacterium]|nr:HAMP domain-containing histidine kinase [Acidobacteriota bacterium]